MYIMTIPNGELMIMSGISTPPLTPPSPSTLGGPRIGKIAPNHTHYTHTTDRHTKFFDQMYDVLLSNPQIINGVF